MAGRRLKLPDSASVAIAGADARLFAPSAARNIESILQVMGDHIPTSGTALEIASGTGEHILRYAAAFEGLDWQPSDVDETRLASIKAWIDQAGLDNIRAPVELNATEPNWSKNHDPFALIVLVNLLHLISRDEVETLIHQAATALRPGGVFLIYGPFLRGDRFASDGDENFHHSLQSQDPDIGYKSFEDIQTLQARRGLSAEPKIDMPANNLILIARKPAQT